MFCIAFYSSDCTRSVSLSKIIEAPEPASVANGIGFVGKTGRNQPDSFGGFYVDIAAEPARNHQFAISSKPYPASFISVFIPAQIADLASCTDRMSCSVSNTPVPGSSKAGWPFASLTYSVNHDRLRI